MHRDEIFNLWRQMRREEDCLDLSQFIQATIRALDLGEPLVAIEFCSKVIADHRSTKPMSNRAYQLKALALARAGADAAAQEVIQAHIDLLSNDSELPDSEGLGILARTFKHLWVKSNGAADQNGLLKKSLTYYEKAYSHSPRVWIGVNIAALYLASGRVADAYSMALEVLAQCEGGSSGEDPWWTLLTKAECQLILGDYTAASSLYAKAREIKVPFGRIASARSNAALILQASPTGGGNLKDIFPGTGICIFSGHRVDVDGGEANRFPKTAIDKVSKAIHDYLEQNKIEVGIGSAADGADILFHEALQKLGVESHIVLPSDAEIFIQTSVREDYVLNWRKRFEIVLEQATSVTELTREARDPIDFIYANQVIMGIAKSRAQYYGGELSALVVWDGRPGLPGGTGSAVSIWQSQDVPMTTVIPKTGEMEPRKSIQALHSFEHDLNDRGVAALLFADAKGFSKLSSAQVSLFVDYILAPMGLQLDKFGERILCRNTWGDALYVAFTELATAAQFALEIIDSCYPEKLKSIGLPVDLGFRVSLHAGPIRMIYDPVSKANNCIGSHVSLAARIEPITPTGAVYCSEAFAALHSLNSDYLNIECAYVGHVPLAKNFGVLPIYTVRHSYRAVI